MSAPGGERDGVPELAIADHDAAVLDLLRRMQRAALVHADAARALFASLVEEGRLFAQTAEGARWHDRILRSALLERALLVWQSATLWTTEDLTPGTPPSALIDAVAAAARSPGRDALVERLFADARSEG